MSQRLDAPDTRLGGPTLNSVPDYLRLHYWWAYVHPIAVWMFERAWLVNLILWFNYRRLSAAALAALEDTGRPGKLAGRTLQVACVYGDLTPRLARCSASGDGSLDVIDVLPIQLRNLARKLPPGAPARLLTRNADDLALPDGSYDRALLFFLLHEQPETSGAAPCGRLCVWSGQGAKWWWSTTHGRAPGIPRGIFGCRCCAFSNRSRVTFGNAT